VSVDRAILRGLQRFGGYCAHLALESVLRLGIGLLLLVGAPGAAAALAPYALGAVASLALGRAMLGEDAAPPVDVTEARRSEAGRSELGRFALPMLALALADAGYQSDENHDDDRHAHRGGGGHPGLPCRPQAGRSAPKPIP